MSSFAFANSPEKDLIRYAFQPHDLLLPAGGVCAKFQWIKWEDGGDNGSKLSSVSRRLRVLCMECTASLEADEAEQAWRSAERIVEFVTNSTHGTDDDELAGEECIVALMVAGMAACNRDELDFAHVCFRTAAKLLPSDHGAPVLAVCLSYASAVTFAREGRYEEALPVASRARKIAMSLRHDVPDLYCYIAGLEIAMRFTLDDFDENELAELIDFAKLRQSRLGIVNAHVALISQLRHKATFDELLKVAKINCKSESMSADVALRQLLVIERRIKGSAERQEADKE